MGTQAGLWRGDRGGGNRRWKMSGEHPHLQETPLQDMGRSLELLGLAPNAVCERQREGSRTVLGPDVGRGEWEGPLWPWHT